MWKENKQQARETEVQNHNQKKKKKKKDLKHKYYMWNKRRNQKNYG